MPIAYMEGKLWGVFGESIFISKSISVRVIYNDHFITKSVCFIFCLCAFQYEILVLNNDGIFLNNTLV